MYVEITTAAERVAIENAMCPIMDNLERAGRMLLRIQEEYFCGHAESLQDGEYQDVKDILSAVGDTIGDCVTAYYMTTGREDGGYSGSLAGSVKRFEMACRIRKALDAAEAHGVTKAAVTGIMGLPDEVAAARLHEMGVTV